MAVGMKVASETETTRDLRSSRQRKLSVTNVAIISDSDNTLITIVESHVTYFVTSIFQPLPFRFGSANFTTTSRDLATIPLPIHHILIITYLASSSASMSCRQDICNCHLTRP